MTSALIMCYFAVVAYCSILLSSLVFKARDNANEFLELVGKDKEIGLQSVIVLCVGCSAISFLISPIILYSVLYDYEGFKDSFILTLANRMKLKGIR